MFRNEKSRDSGITPIAITNSDYLAEPHDIGKTAWSHINNNKINRRIGYIYAAHENLTPPRDQNTMYRTIDEQMSQT